MKLTSKGALKMLEEERHKTSNDTLDKSFYLCWKCCR